MQGLKKEIPDSPKGEVPVHLRDKQIFADHRIVVFPWEKDVGIRKDGKDTSKPQDAHSLKPDPSAKKPILTETARQ